MSTITMTVEYQGRTYPLSQMGWYQVRPDGVTIGVIVAATSTHTCNWTTSGHENPCDNAWFEHAAEEHPERPIR